MTDQTPNNEYSKIFTEFLDEIQNFVQNMDIEPKTAFMLGAIINGYLHVIHLQIIKKQEAEKQKRELDTDSAYDALHVLKDIAVRYSPECNYESIENCFGTLETFIQGYEKPRKGEETE